MRFNLNFLLLPYSTATVVSIEVIFIFTNYERGGEKERERETCLYVEINQFYLHLTDMRN